MSYYTKFSPALISGFHPFTIAFLDAMSSPLSWTKSVVVDKFVKRMVRDNLWAPLSAAYIHSLTDSQQSRLNLINPGTDTLTVVGTVPFTADLGFSCTGNVSNRLAMSTACGSLPTFSQNSASFGSFIQGNTAQNALFCGEVSQNNWLCANNGASCYARINDALNLNSGINNLSGLKAVNRSSSTVKELYELGVLRSTGSTSSSSGGLGNVFNFVNAGTSIPQTNGVIRFSFIGGSMDATQHSALNDAVVELLANL